MLETIKNAFKTKEIRNKLLFVFFGLIIVRIGCNIPLPGVNTNVIQNLFDNNQALNFLDVMTGGSFTRMSIFALNITPYITASIIVQLLTIAIPRLEELQKDGEDGRKKINEYTRYLSIVLALVEGLAIVIGFRNQGFFTESGYTSVIISVVALTAGAAFLMWLGEEITEKGIGNGISIILLINIVARIPSDLISLYNQFIKSAEKEFREIYGMDVVEVPTNKPIARIDYNDSVYKTKREKLNAIVEDIADCYERKQPVLVGTITIEASEELSEMLKRRGIKHKVLNAKYHELEAEIIADAGVAGAVTIATSNLLLSKFCKSS